MEKKNKLNIDAPIFIPPLILVVVVCLVIVLNPEATSIAFNAAKGFLCNSFAWMFEILCAATLVFVLGISFSKYGNVRLGKEKPEYSTFTWLSMIFSGATSASVLLWGTIEFYYYVTGGEFGAAPFSNEAYEWASAYGMFHWGALSNSTYAILAIAFAYMFFVRKKEVVIRPSAACREVLGKHSYGLLGKIIDILYLFAVIACLGTSLGLATPLVAELFCMVFGTAHTLLLDAIIILAWIALIAAQIYTGLKKGMKLIANLRTWLTFAFLAYVLLAGPTAFILNNTTQGIGIMLQNFVRMTFYTDAFNFTGFPQIWTVFFLTWCIGYVVQMGIYFARISKGRTIREVGLGVIGATALGAVVVFGILGSYGEHVLFNGIVDVVKAIAEGGTALAVAEIWASLPGSVVVIPFMLVLCFVATSTLLSSSAYTMAMSTHKCISADEEPAKWNRLFWCFVLGALALALLFLGGLDTLQTIAIVGSTPMVFVLIIIVIGFCKNLKEDLANKKVTTDPKTVFPEEAAE